MNTRPPKNILIAPLDWGLGHTTRCIPLISYVLRTGHIPIIACNKHQSSFLREVFPDVEILSLEGYNIIYSRWNKFIQVGLLSQLPGIRRTINAEHKWLLRLTGERNIDGIISDNRYGLHHPSIPSVILTHQLMVRSGLGHWAGAMIQRLHYSLLCRFAATWVVDIEKEPSLAGELSHCNRLLANCRYIGLLSQFAVRAIADSGNTDNSILILLSGPEPLRTELSNFLWSQVVGHQGKVIFVEGSESVAARQAIPPHIIYHKRLTRSLLQNYLEAADIVICRSGYSTIMDLVALGKKAVFIPTPGQTEQEYLAGRLGRMGCFTSVAQNKFNLHDALARAGNSSSKFSSRADAYKLHEAVLDNWLKTL